MHAPYFTRKNRTNKLRKWEQALEDVNGRKKAFELQKAVLLVVDMQQYFCNPKSHAFVPSVPTIIPAIRKLIDAFRAERRPVIYTVFAVRDGEQDPIARWWNDSVRDDTKECRIIDELEHAQQDHVIRKRSYSAFLGTDLETYLHERNAEQILIAGVVTNLCCEQAAREAFVRNFDVFVALDATAAYSEDMHIASLRTLAYGFATIIRSDAL